MIFISHSSADSEKAVKLYKRLVERGFKVWLDKYEIAVGDDITQKISLGLNGAEFLILILTPRSVASKWVEEEWSSIYSRQIEEGKVKVLPALFEECKMPDLLRGKMHADFKDFEFGFNQILDAISKHGNKEVEPQKEEILGMGETMLNELIDDILQKSKSLSIIMFEAFKLSKALKLPELNDFTRNELEGYSQEQIVEGRDYSFRTIEGYLTLGKIGKIQLGLNQTIEDFWMEIDGHEDFFKQSFIYPETINTIEDQLPKIKLYRKGIFQLTTKSTKFFDTKKDYDLTFIARRESLPNLYRKVGKKLQSKILSYL